MSVKKSDRATNEFCLCGCGEKITPSSTKGFVAGHHKRTPEARAAQGEKMKGNILSPEVRERIRISNTGRIHTAQSRANMGAARIGKKHSDEWRAKQSASLKGRKFSAESRAKMSASQKLVKHLPEQNIKRGRKGHPAYPNQQKAATESNVRRWMLIPRSPTSKHKYPRGWSTARLFARRRDENRCMMSPDHILKSGSGWALDIHHIDSYKDNLSPQNLICLCRSCHLIAERDLGESIPRLHAILAERYGYVYE